MLRVSKQNQSVDSAEYVIVAQSVVSLPNDSSPFMLTGITSAGAGALVAGRRFGERRARSNAAVFDAFRHGASRPWNARSAVPAPFLVSPTTALAVGSVRSFVVCGDLTCDSTVRVGAVAQAVGTNVAIYIDTLNPAGTPTAGLAPGDLDSLLHLLDTRIAPLDVQTFGGVSDVDGNGVVIALLTPVVNRLVTRIACEQNGFIAGFFFPGDLAPHGAYNNGEIYYSVVPDPDSLASCAHTVAAVEQLTPPTFAHELEHMINYGQHVLSRPSGPGPEEGWLDEGLARYAEELAARSFLPGDTATFHGYLRFGDLYDAYQYLLNPGDSYLLLVEDNGTLAETKRQLALHPVPRRSVRPDSRRPPRRGAARRARERRVANGHRVPDAGHKLGSSDLGLRFAGLPTRVDPPVHVVVVPRNLRFAPPLERPGNLEPLPTPVPARARGDERERAGRGG